MAELAAAKPFFFRDSFIPDRRDSPVVDKGAKASSRGIRFRVEAVRTVSQFHSSLATTEAMTITDVSKGGLVLLSPYCLLASLGSPHRPKNKGSCH